MSLFTRLFGTVGSFFQIGGPGGPGWNNNEGALEAKNSANSALVVARVAEPIGANDATPNGDHLLNAEPSSLGNSYANVKSGNRVTSETWTTTATSLATKSIAYTYTGSRVTTEVRKVFSAADGVTVIAQMTLNYSYTGSSVTSATVTRDI
jgi:hypothetical protein